MEVASRSSAHGGAANRAALAADVLSRNASGKSRELKPAVRLGWAGAGILFWAVGYYGAPRLAGAAAFDPALPIDASLPCMPALVWLYLLGLAVPLLPAWLMPARLFARTLCAYALLIGSATVLFIVVPTDGQALRARCPAPAGWALEAVRRFDPAANLFPSLHIGFAVLATLCAARAGSRLTPFLAIAAAAVAVSACLIGQHYVLDTIAGALLASAVFAIAFAGSQGGGVIQPWPVRKPTSRRATSSNGGSGTEVGAASRAPR
jgi:membrane-associated phospholipid phosphatase